MALDVTKLDFVEIRGKARGGKYALILNPMQFGAKHQEAFGPFETPEEALAFHDAELVMPYEDTDIENNSLIYRKTFRKDGPLEWMNPLVSYQRGDGDKETGFGVWTIAYQVIEWEPIEAPPVC